MVFESRAQPALLVLVFAAVCVMSAMALLYTKHEARKLFVELETLTRERDDLNIEWVIGIDHAQCRPLSPGGKKATPTKVWFMCTPPCCSP